MSLYPNFKKTLSLFSVFTVLICSLLLNGCITSSPYNSPWSALPQKTAGSQPEMKPEIGWQKQSARLPELELDDTYNTQGNGQAMLSRYANMPANDPIQSQRHLYQQPTPSYLEIQPNLLPPNPRIGSKVIVSILLPLSGPKADLGNAMLDAAQMALFDISNPNITLSPHDTKGTPIGARNAAIEAVTAGSSLILGPLFSTSLKEVTLITKRHNIPVISFSTDWSQAGNNVYIMGFMPFVQVARVTQYAQSQGYNKFAIFAPQTQYSNIAIRTLNHSIKRSHLNLVRSEKFSPYQQDLSNIVRDFVDYDTRVALLEETRGMLEAQLEYDPRAEEKLNELKRNVTLGEVPFDALFLPMGGETLRSVSTLLSYYDIDNKNVRFLGTGLWDDPQLLTEPAMYGAWFAAPDPKLREGFEMRYKRNFKKKAPRLTTLAYDATALVSTLARNVKNDNDYPYNKERLTETRGFAGIDGVFRFRPDGLVERGLAILEIEKGQVKVIDPAPSSFF